MSDNHKRHNAIKHSLEQLYGAKVEGHLQPNLHTLALLINGIIGAGSVQLPRLALKAPTTTQVASRTAKLTRFIKNEHITDQLYWLPFARSLLAALSSQGKGLTVVMDGSAVGRGCAALVGGGLRRAGLAHRLAGHLWQQRSFLPTAPPGTFSAGQ